MLANVDHNLYPTDNEWGIPSLLPQQPVQIVAPVVRWGSVGRSTKHGGTWVLYVDDYRFGSHATLASRLARTEPAVCAEPNYTAYGWSPRAAVLWDVYRKRLVARQLQWLGIQVLVDVCVPEEHYDLALLGVPRGWTDYSTRGFEARPDDIRREHELATSHAGGPIQLLVYGGGPRVAETCTKLHALHIKTPKVPNG